MKKASLFIILIILATFGVAVAAQYKVITKDAPVRKDKRFLRAGGHAHTLRGYRRRPGTTG